MTVSNVEPQLAVEADRDLLFAAVGNLLQNAFKFTRQHTEVRLSAHAAADRIRIEVEDKCGGLPRGNPEEMFLPFKKGSSDNTGLGLGLSISRNSVEANDGILIPPTTCPPTLCWLKRATGFEPATSSLGGPKAVSSAAVWRAFHHPRRPRCISCPAWDSWLSPRSDASVKG